VTNKTGANNYFDWTNTRRRRRVTDFTFLLPVPLFNLFPPTFNVEKVSFFEGVNIYGLSDGLSRIKTRLVLIQSIVACAVTRIVKFKLILF
jgi:hypothetical protein